MTDSVETKEKIVKAAMELYRCEGCKRVTMDQIAAQLHISKRTLYAMFATKEDLLSACLDEVHKEIGSSFCKLTSQEEEPMLLALYLMRNTVVINHRYGTMLCDIERYYPQIHTEFHKVHSNVFRTGVLQTLKEAQERNLLRPNVNLEEISDLMTSFMHKDHTMPQHEKEAYMRKVNEMAFTFFRGLMTVEAIQLYDSQEERFKEITNNTI